MSSREEVSKNVVTCLEALGLVVNTREELESSVTKEVVEMFQEASYRDDPNKYAW